MRSPHRAVLLCDHVLAGSDTSATANALAAAIEWIGGADLVPVRELGDRW